MIEIKDLLSRFEKVFGQEKSKIKTIQSTLHFFLGVSVDKSNIKIKNNIIYLDIKPILKNNLFFKKKEFLISLSDKGIFIEDVF